MDRILEPDSPELTELLKRDHDASGHRTDHANALSLMSFYAGRAPATALLLWALEGHVLDIRPHNLWCAPMTGTDWRRSPYAPRASSRAVWRRCTTWFSSSTYYLCPPNCTAVREPVCASCTVAWRRGARWGSALRPARK